VTPQLTRLIESIQEVDRALEAFDSSIDDFSGASVMRRNLVDQRSRLQEQLLIELSGQRTPSLQFTFEGPPVRGESVEAPFASRAIDQLQEIIESVGQALWGQPTAKGPIPNEVRTATQLRLAGVAHGSFGVLLLGDIGVVQQNVFRDSVDISLLEQAIARVLDVFESASQGFSDERILDDLAELGPRSANRLSRLCKTLARANATTKFTWESPQVERRQSTVTPSAAAGLVDFLSEIDRDIDSVEAIGRLIGARLHKDMFDLELEDRTVLEGRSSPEARDKMQQFFGRECLAVLQRTVVRSKRGRESIEKYLLVDLREATSQ
jgi:hypothetical protein